MENAGNHLCPTCVKSRLLTYICSLAHEESFQVCLCTYSAKQYLNVESLNHTKEISVYES